MTDTYVPDDEHAYAGEPEGSGPPAAARVRSRAGGSRVPPQALDAERAVLAAMMLDSTAIAVAVQTVIPDDFYRPAHRRICAAVYRMFEKNEAVDIVTLSDCGGGAAALEWVMRGTNGSHRLLSGDRWIPGAVIHDRHHGDLDRRG